MRPVGRISRVARAPLRISISAAGRISIALPSSGTARIGAGSAQAGKASSAARITAASGGLFQNTLDRFQQGDAVEGLQKDARGAGVHHVARSEERRVGKE